MSLAFDEYGRPFIIIRVSWRGEKERQEEGERERKNEEKKAAMERRFDGSMVSLSLHSRASLCRSLARVSLLSIASEDSEESSLSLLSGPARSRTQKGQRRASAMAFDFF